MFLFDLIDGVRRDIATDIAEHKMIKAENSMYKDVTVGDTKKTLAAYEYSKATGCDFGVAIDKFFKTPTVTVGHMQAALKIFAEAGVPVEKQQLYTDMYGVITVSVGIDNIAILREAGFRDSDILDFQSWCMHHHNDVKKLSDLALEKLPGEKWIPKANYIQQAPTPTPQTQTASQPQTKTIPTPIVGMPTNPMQPTPMVPLA